MTNRIKTIRNSLSYIIIGLLPFLSNFLLLPVYTRYLTPEDYGALSVVSTFGAMLTTFMALQLSSALPRFYFDVTEEDVPKLFSSFLFAVIGISISSILVIGSLGQFLIDLLFSESDLAFSPLFLIGIVTAFFSQISVLVERLLVVQERGGTLLWRSVVSQLVAITSGLLLIVVFQFGVLGALLSSLIGAIVTSILNLIVVREYLVWIVDRVLVAEGVKYSWPLVFHAIGGYLFMYSDVVVMGSFISLSAIGTYAIATKFSDILKLTVNAISNALVPGFFQMATEDKEKAVGHFKGVISLVSIPVAFAWLLLALFSGDLLRLLVPVEYHSATELIPVLLLSFIFRWLYCFASAPLFFMKKTKSVPFITFSAGFFNVAANILLIPKFGLLGVAWATVMSFCICFVLAYYIAKRDYSMDFDWAQLGLIFGLMFVAYFGAQLGAVDSVWGMLMIKSVACILFVVLCVIFNIANVQDELRMLCSKVLWMRGVR